MAGAPDGGASISDSLPDTLGRRGQADIRNAERRQRIEDCVDHGRGRTHRAPFTHTLHADRVRCAGNRMPSGGKFRHIAMCQRSGKVWVFRDTDKDGKPDEKLVMEEGMFGINIHRHAHPDEKEYVGGSSAGCQVFKSSRQFVQFMSVCNRAADKYGNSFTYTLIKEKDLQD